MKSQGPSIDLPAAHVLGDELPALLTIADADGTVIFCNRPWYTYTGHLPDASNALNWRQYVHPDDVSNVAAAWAAALTGSAGLVRFRYRLLCAADGEYHWFEAHARPVRGADGEALRWIALAVVDDTPSNEGALQRAEQATAELQNVERALHESNAHVRALADSIPVIAFTTTPDGAVEWINRGWSDYTGQTADEAKGWGWQSAHHPDDLAASIGLWQKRVATGTPLEAEFRLRDRNGSYRWFLCRAKPFRDERGKIVRWYGSTVDIDDQKRALHRSMQIAETLQRASLPEALPQREGVHFDAVYLPAERPALIGGDWYDVFDLPGGRLGISIGDVAGHGLVAAVAVGQLRQAILTLAMEFDDPAVVLRKVNRSFLMQRRAQYASAFVAILDADLRSLHYASAGHPPPFVARAAGGNVETLELGGTMLGVDVDSDAAAHHVELSEGDVVIFYTDGLTESARDVVSGEKMLHQALADAARNRADRFLARTIREAMLPEGGGRDDVALLAMRIAPDPVSPAVDEPSPEVRKAWHFHSSDAYTARLVRREMMRYLREHVANDEHAFFEAELIVGEILSNAVKHAPGFVEIEVNFADSRPAVVVHDSGPGLKAGRPELPLDQFEEGGRGLFLIHALSHEMAVGPAQADGAEIRVVLPLVPLR